MDLEFEPDEEYQESVFYAKTLKDSKELCIICQVDETAEGKQWDRYITKCGHMSHTRCFRRWCGRKRSVNCPYCGDIPMTPQNAYCSLCETFGHGIFHCMLAAPKRRKAKKR